MRQRNVLVAKLVREGEALVKGPRETATFETGIPDAELLLNDLRRYPHLFVFGCVMDRQIKYGRAWAIPYKVGLAAGGFAFRDFKKLSLRDLERLFLRERLHRFNKKMARHFREAIGVIDQAYGGKASRIWNGNPPSARVIRRFLEFPGVGIKIATMAANILVRDFKIPMSELSSIDISPDRRVTRFFEDKGLVRRGACREELIYLARELSPSFPGLLDNPAFIGGKYQRKRA